jgi:SAM-dependent methyltransferase
MVSQTKKDIQNIINLVEIDNKSVLELGCGNGRITFAIADKVRELVAIDIDEEAIKESQNKNKYGNVVFQEADIENFDLGRKFEIILSIGVGYMYLKNTPNAIECILIHLEEEGIFLLICSSPETEYQRIVDLLVEENVRTTSFYDNFEKILSKYFTFEKKLLKNQLTFSNLEDIFTCFKRELKEEYQTEMNENHELTLIEYFQHKDSLIISDDSQAYLCRK